MKLETIKWGEIKTRKILASAWPCENCLLSAITSANEGWSLISPDEIVVAESRDLCL